MVLAVLALIKLHFFSAQFGSAEELPYLLMEGYWNQKCQDWTQFDSKWQTRWMNPDCNYDTREELTWEWATNRLGEPINAKIYYDPKDYFVANSDWKQECEDIGWDLTKLGDGVWHDDCDKNVWGWDLGDCGSCNKNCWPQMLGDGNCDNKWNRDRWNQDNGDWGYCKKNSGCTKEMYENNVWDQECNIPECNYDNGGWGGYWCGTCHSTMMNDGECQDACFNSADCSHDGNDCNCSTDCTYERRNEETCNEHCNNIEWDWHDYKWDSCTQELLDNDVCDDICNTYHFNYDNLKCGNYWHRDWNNDEHRTSNKCHTDWLTFGWTFDLKVGKILQSRFDQLSGGWNKKKMSLVLAYQIINEDFLLSYDRSLCHGDWEQDELVNDVCDEDCNTEGCFYDLGRCWARDEAEKEGVLALNPSRQGNTTTTWFGIHSKGDGTSYIGCTPVEYCHQKFGDLCHYWYNDKCLGCDGLANPEGLQVYQIYHECDVVCPDSHPVAANTENICYPKEPTTTEGNPQVMYVWGMEDPRPSLYETGTTELPYFQLTGALASWWENYTVIKLQNLEHLLDQFNTDYFLETFFNEDPSSPLQKLGTKRSVKRIIVEPDWCSTSSGPYYSGCGWISTGSKVTLKIPSYKPTTTDTGYFLTFDLVGIEVEFRDIIIDGSLILQPQSGWAITAAGDFCSYWPAATKTDTNDWEDDRNIEITGGVTLQTSCDEFADKFLFKMSDNATLTMTNVKFYNIRSQHKAIIYADGKNTISLTNVEFDLIQTKAVEGFGALTLTWSTDDNLCPTFSMLDGSVTNVNYGYVYNSDLTQTGWLNVNAHEGDIILTKVAFSDNVVIVGENGSTTLQEQGSLIFINTVQTLLIDNCSFNRNLGTQAGAIRILPYEDNTRDNEVTISNNNFANNGSLSKGGAIGIEFRRELYNIILSSNVFKENSSHTDHSIVYIINTSTTPLSDNQINGYNTTYTGSNGEVVETIINSNFVEINGNDFEDNGSHGKGVLVIQKMANVSLKEGNNFKGNKDYDVVIDLSAAFRDIMTVVIEEFLLTGHYINGTFNYDQSAIPCTATVSLEYCAKVTMTNVTFNENSCEATIDNLTAGLSLIGITKSFSAENMTFSNQSNEGARSSALYILSACSMPFVNTTFVNNVCSNTCEFGTVYIESTGATDYISFTSTTFQDNEGANAAAIKAKIWSLILTQTEFITNKAGVGQGIVSVENSGEIDYMEFVLDRCTFTENESVRQGAVYIQRTSKIRPAILTLWMDTTTFDSNTAKLGAAMFISSGVNLSDTSWIRECTFTSNSASIRGVLYLAFDQGILDIWQSTFTSNRGEASGMYIITLASRKQTVCKTVVNNSIFSRNEGSTIIDLGDTGLLSSVEISESTFTENTGVCVSSIYGSITDKNSSYKNNSSKDGTALTLGEKTEYTATDLVFELNQATDHGGAVYVKSFSVFSCTNCSYNSNSASKGGAIFIEQQARIALENVVFTSNTATDRGSALYMTNSKTTPVSLIQSCTFTNNEVKYGGTIYGLESSLEAVSITISDNTCEEASAGIVLVLSTITVDSSSFSRQKAQYGGFLLASTASTATFTSTSFTDIVVTGIGGAIYSLASTTTLDNWTISKSTANIGGAIYASNKGQLIVKNSSFSNLTALENSGILFAYACTISIEGSTFTTFSKSGINTDLIDSLSIVNSTFMNGDYLAASGAVVSSQRGESIYITDNKFSNNTALIGGALYLSTQADLPMSAIYQILRNEFSYNSASQSGAIYTNNVNVNVTENTFTNNIANSSYIYADLNSEAHLGNGGALILDCTDMTTCDLTIHRNIFINNTASKNGGAMSWIDVQPKGLSDNTFANNLAAYGNDISSYATHMVEVNQFGNVVRRIQEEDEIHLEEIAPGQQGQISIRLAPIDHYGQIVSTDQSSTWQIVANDTSSTTLSGTTQVTTVDGIWEFNNFEVSALPGTKIVLSIVSSAIDIDKASKANDGVPYATNVDLDVALRTCETGEITQGNECIVCGKDQYSLNPNDEVWNDWPDEAVCLGNYTMYPRSGYWRTSIHTDYFWECPNVDAWIGSPDAPEIISFKGDCRSGYVGNMWQSCEEGYSRSQRNQCGACPDATVNAIRLCLVLILAIVLVGIMVKTSLKTALRPKALHSVYIKIFLNYLQLVTLTASFDLQWPRFVLYFFSLQEETASVQEQVFSFDWYFDANEGKDAGVQVYYDKLVLYSFFPVMVLIITFVFWLVYSIIKKNFWYLKYEFVATIVILFFLIHPRLIKNMFSAFSCMEIEDGKMWLVENLEIQCWEEKHLFYVLAVALPSIVIWGIGVPALCLTLLYTKFKKRLNEVNVKVRFGFLYNGYEKQEYYWEFVIMYRKIAVIWCSVFLGNISIPVQALTVLMVLITALHVQNQVQPFSSYALNQMEIRAIIVASVTIYCGLYYLTNDINEHSKIILFAIMLFSNAYFLVYWIYKMCGAGIYIARAKCRCLRSFIPSKNIEDGYDDDLTVKKDYTDSIRVINAKETQYSFLAFKHLTKMETKESSIFIPEQELFGSMDEFYLDCCDKYHSSESKKTMWHLSSLDFNPNLPPTGDNTLRSVRSTHRLKEYNRSPTGSQILEEPLESSVGFMSNVRPGLESEYVVAKAHTK